MNENRSNTRQRCRIQHLDEVSMTLAYFLVLGMSLTVVGGIAVLSLTL